MKINWCVISFKFNFLAEAVLKTIPENRNGEIFIIHAGKPDGFSADFNDFGKVTEVFEIKDKVLHGQNLDRILINKLYPQIIDCDWLVTMDHDIYINDQEYILQLIAENCSADNLAKFAIIACENHWSSPESNFIRYFLTTPLLLINMQYPWADSPSWNIVLTEDTGDSSGTSQLYYDTGQLLAEHLGKERIKCFPQFPDHVLHHFFSEWQWMSDPHYKEHEHAWFAASVSRTKMLLRNGFFIPSQREIPVMRRYLYFREVLDELKEEGLEWC
jgi:glycosyltransferase involved in cell wall biosynthesis